MALAWIWPIGSWNKYKSIGTRTLAKNLKLRIKNTQLAKALKLDGLKEKVAKKKATEQSAEEEVIPKEVEQQQAQVEESLEVKATESATESGSAPEKPEAPRRVVRARSKSAFEDEEETVETEESEPSASVDSEVAQESDDASCEQVAELAQELGEEPAQEELKQPAAEKLTDSTQIEEAASVEKVEAPKDEPESSVSSSEQEKQAEAPRKEEPVAVKRPEKLKARDHSHASSVTPKKKNPVQQPPESPRPKLGPTGRHVRDLLPPAKKPSSGAPSTEASDLEEKKGKGKKAKVETKATDKRSTESEDAGGRKGGKPGHKGKEFRDFKSARLKQPTSGFDGRDRRGLRSGEEGAWRKKRGPKRAKASAEDTTIRPSELSIRLPIMLKDLAAEMKLKAAQLISKLFMQGIVVTLNDYLDDETMVQVLGEEFGCSITIDTSEEERIRITDKSISDEIAESDEDKLQPRAPIVAFMGHVDHGKTSLMDAIRESNVVSGEAGAITQHIGAFSCETSQGPIAFLDTPGHEAFSAMRMRGAELTDIVVLVVAGDEGMRDQTVEAIKHAKAAGVTIVVAINKCDKAGFDVDNVYRQLSEQELLPESWGGQTITVNTSAVSKEGIPELLEMLALQAEVLELRANPHSRARGTVIEAEMHKGLGHVATVMVQNGTLKNGDALVFASEYGRVRTMRDEHGDVIEEAGPAMPVRITGLSGIPQAGEEFIVVEAEQEARNIAEARRDDVQYKRLMVKKALNVENLLQQATESAKKVLHVILRADMHGSLEAVKEALLRIDSDKVSVNIVSEAVGEVSESDVDLASASGAVIVGFHTQVESHAESMIRTLGVSVKLYDVIYHAVDGVKEMMLALLDKVATHEDRGTAEIKQVFRSPSVGRIAGCIVTSGTIKRNYHTRVMRDGECVWSGPIASLKRVKEDVKEVQNGFECGMVLQNFSDIQEGDTLETYEVIYQIQKL